MDLYFELAQGSSIRLCRELENGYVGDLQGWPLELLMNICFVAYDSEVYYGVCEDAWLRSTIVLEGDLDSIFPEGSPERDEISGLPKHLVLQRLSQILREPASKIKIHSNVLPREAYRQKLALELERQSVWTRVQSLVRRRSPCCAFRRGFDPIRVFDEAQRGDLSLMQERMAWRRDGGRCDLATLLQSRGVPFRTVREAVGKEGLRKIEGSDVQLTQDAPVSLHCADVEIHIVSWHNATYVRKKFNFRSTFERESLVAWRVLHPHIVHSFGYFDVSDDESTDSSKSCLLMEMLSGNLDNFLIDNAKSAIRRPFSLADALEVLLQVASAVEHMHHNDIVHGDLKPQNILISHFEISGDVRHFLAKVSGFGGAQVVTDDGSFIPIRSGTTRFAAPELLQLRDNSNLMFFGSDLKKMDVYSFGGVAYEVLTGQEVHNGMPQSTIRTGTLRPRYSTWQRMRTIGCPIDLLERCWAFEPLSRPSFEELRIALETSKFIMQRLERISAALLNCMAVFFACFMIYFLLGYVFGRSLWYDRLDTVVMSSD